MTMILMPCDVQKRNNCHSCVELLQFIFSGDLHTLGNDNNDEVERTSLRARDIISGSLFYSLLSKILFKDLFTVI